MLAELSLVVSVAGALPYLYATLKSEVRPERTTWGIWTLVLLLSVIAYDAAGGEKSVWFLAGDLLITAVIFLVSLVKGVGGWSRLDLACMGVALLGLLTWILSGSPLWQMIGTLTADMVAVVPTIRKSLDDPMSESATTFAASSLAALMGVFSVGQWNVLLLFYPIYLYTANFLTAVVIGTGRYHAKKQYIRVKE